MSILAITVALWSPNIAIAQTAPQSLSPAADAEYLANWGLKMINALPAYLKGLTGKGIIVAVSDTGLDINHPEFLGRISPKLRNFGTDKKPDDVSHAIYKNKSLAGHGSHVAGIIGAARDGVGMQGVAYGSVVLPLRSIEVEGYDTANEALRYAADNGAQIFNGSYGPPEYPTPEMQDQFGSRVANPNYKVLNYQSIFFGPQDLKDEYSALSYAAKKDVVLVFAAGNGRRDQPGQYTEIPSGAGMFPLITPDYIKSGKIKFLDTDAMSRNDDLQNPSTYKFLDPTNPKIATMDLSDLKGSLIAVVAVGKDGKLASYSNRCGDAAEWCIAAPGGTGDGKKENNIYSTWPTNDPVEGNIGYNYLAGTSMAAPHVTGAAAVVRSAFPFMNARQTIETILTTTTKNGYEDQALYGQGLLNLGAAVEGPMAFREMGVFDVDTKGYSAVWSNPISGPGDFTKRGKGSIILTGENSYSGPTNVVGGTLAVEGSITSSTTVSDTGRLSGLGTVGDVIVDKGGIITPGSALDPSKHIGTLTVNGDLTFLPGSTYEVEVNSKGSSSDRLQVNGSATLTGGTVLHIGEGGIYNPLSTYRILTTNTALIGEFGSVSSKFAFLNPTLQYVASGKAVDLKLLRNDVKFTDMATTGNQKVTAIALDSLPVGDSTLYNAVVSLSDDKKQISSSFDSLSGEVYAFVKGTFVNDSAYVRSAVYNRLEQALGGTPTSPVAVISFGSNQKTDNKDTTATDRAVPAFNSVSNDDLQRYVAWGSAFGGWGTQSSGSSTGKTKSAIGGFMTGIDTTVYDNWRLGVLAGYSRSTFKARALSSSGNSDDYTLGTYAGTEWEGTKGAIAFHSGLAYTRHNLSMNRLSVFSGFDDRLSADYNASVFQVFGELGYKFKNNEHLLIEPYVNLAYVSLKTDGFSEKGLNGATLNVHSSTMNTSLSTLGIRATTSFEFNTIAVTARVDLGWRHAFGGHIPLSTASFDAGSDVFTTSGASIGTDVALIETGLDFQLSQNATLGIAYQGQFGSGMRQNGFSTKFSVTF